MNWLEHFRQSTSTAAFSVGCVHTTDVAALVARVNRCGILAGSRSYGVETEGSDWDYVVRAQDFPEIDLRILENARKAYQLPTLGFKLAYRSRYTGGDGIVVLNLLVCRSEPEFQAWVTCVQQMIWLANLHPFVHDLCREKDVRVAIFEELRRRSGILADDDPGTPEQPNVLPFEPPKAKAIEPTWSAPVGVPSPDDEPPF